MFESFEINEFGVYLVKIFQENEQEILISNCLNAKSHLTEKSK